MKFYQYIIGTFFVIVLAIVSINGASRAQSFKSGLNADIAKNQTVDSALYATGNNVNIAGTVNGDLYCAGQSINISGIVKGDVFCAGQTVDLSGVVEGSARLAGQNINVNGKIVGSMSLFGVNVGISSIGIVEKDLQISGSSFSLHGKVGRDLVSWARNVEISGVVGRNAQITNETLNIKPGSKISGNLKYRSTETANIAPNTVSGSVTKVAPPAKHTNPSNLAVFLAISYFYWFFAIILISLAAAFLLPKRLKSAAINANKDFFRVTAIGLLSVFITPILLFALALTIIGIPLALIFWLIYLLMLILSGPFFAYYLGYRILPKQKAWLQMLLGTILVLIIYAIPLLNLLAALILVVFGSGMVLSTVYPKKSTGAK